MPCLDINKIIEMHYRLQYGCFFSNVYRHHDTIYSYNDLMDSFIWNHIYCINGETDLEKFSNEAQKYFIPRDRKPCIYIDDKYRNALDSGLNRLAFKCLDNEAWMLYDFHTNPIADNVPLYSIEKIKSADALMDFCAICSECFDPQHSDAIIREYHKYQPHKKIEHFALHIDGKIVSIASIYSSDGFYYIHNVATTECYRKRGLAGNLMRYLLKHISAISDNACVILQCDGGGSTEEFYRKLGFKTIHRRWGYVNEQE